VRNLYKVLAVLVAVGVAPALWGASICPSVGSTNTDCGYILTIAANGSITGAPVVGARPYDGYPGGDDILVGVINNSGGVYTGSIYLTGSGNDGGIFEFDGDGICDYRFQSTMLSYCSQSGYHSDPLENAGPRNTFSGITSIGGGTDNAGYVNFPSGLGGIPTGGTTFFSLEGSPASIAISTVPEPTSIFLLGSCVLGWALIRRRRA
jgi:hypothetical protein